MRKFEYLTRYGDILDEIEEMDNLGAEGWEFVGYYEDRDTAVFKRELFDSTQDDSKKNDSIPVKGSTVVESNTYEDEYLYLKFKDVDSVSNLLFGDGFGFKFLIKNRTDNTITVRAKSVSINGFIVSSNEQIIADLGGHKKAIDSIYLYFNRNNLNDCDVYSADDIAELSFMIEITDEDNDEIHYSSCEFFVSINAIPF